MIAHMLVGEMPRNSELRMYLRRALRESPLTQAQAGAKIGRTQSWFPNTLFADSVKAIRYLFTDEPEVFDKLVDALNLDRDVTLQLAGITIPPPNASVVPLEKTVPVFLAGAGPALDDAQAVDFHSMPISNGGSYEIIGLRVHGDSMSPYLEAGETAYIALEASLIKPGRAIGVYLPDVGSVVKNYVRTLPDGSVLLESLNANGAEKYFAAPADARIYGPVISRLKKD